jgi:cation-transporting P-type ATPase 13A2
MIVMHDRFVPVELDPESDNIVCFENTTVFLFANFQYIASVYAFSTAKPVRKPIYTNGMVIEPWIGQGKWHEIDLFVVVLVPLLGAYMALLVFMTFAVTSLLVYPPEQVADFLELVRLPTQFRIFLCVLALFNCCLLVLLEQGVLSVCKGTAGTGKKKKSQRKKKRARRYRPTPLPLVVSEVDDEQGDIEIRM